METSKVKLVREVVLGEKASVNVACWIKIIKSLQHVRKVKTNNNRLWRLFVDREEIEEIIIEDFDDEGAVGNLLKSKFLPNLKSVGLFKVYVNHKGVVKEAFEKMKSLTSLLFEAPSTRAQLEYLPLDNNHFRECLQRIDFSGRDMNDEVLCALFESHFPNLKHLSLPVHDGSWTSKISLSCDKLESLSLENKSNSTIELRFEDFSGIPNLKHLSLKGITYETSSFERAQLRLKSLDCYFECKKDTLPDFTGKSERKSLESCSETLVHLSLPFKFNDLPSLSSFLKSFPNLLSFSLFLSFDLSEIQKEFPCIYFYHNKKN